MKHFKTTVSIMVLSLMLIPFLSFAQKSQSEQKGVETQNATRLQNQGEEQQNQVELQQNAQTGKKSMNGNSQGKGFNQASDKATQRRSRVANAVQQMLQVAERNQGIGKQIRTIAQNQNQNQKEIETTLEHVKNSGKLKKFFFGPNYKYINLAEGKLATHAEKLEELKKLASQITNEADEKTLEEQIEILEQAKTELEKEIKEERKGFSLFGWLNKMLSK